MAETYSKACCEIPPVASTYEAKGEMTNLAPNMPTYVVGPRDAKHAILIFYDIFGFHNNTKQFADVLASNGKYLVIVPDFLYAGHPSEYTEDDINIGSKDLRKKIVTLIAAKGTIDLLLPKIIIVREWLQAQGAVTAGVVGFCWGAKIAVQLTSRDPFYAAASLIHPSFIDNKDAEEAGAPILAIPTRDEPDMTEYMAILAKKPFGSKNRHHRFDDMHHGFAASRGDYNDAHNRKRATESIQLTVHFFNANL